MAKAPNTNVPAVVEENKSALPAFLQTQGKTAKLGNIDTSDLIIPRIKLLQAISPEVTEFDEAKAGEFWHTLAGESLGGSLRFVPLVIRKSFTLWAPRGDTRGVLARAPDGVHWDKVEEFEVKLKGVKNPVKWKTAATVQESGLAEFGSSNPDEENSPPAATLTYNILGYFLDHPELSPAVLLNARSAVKAAKQLISKIEMRPVDHFAQVFKVGATQEQGAEGPYFNYKYVADGYVQDETQYKAFKEMHARYGDASWRANEEDGDTGDASAAPKGGDVGGKGGKF